ncbi:BRO family protein [Clostridioides difficile]
MNNIMNFENKKVEVFEWNGQVLFNPYHVAECLDITDVKSSIRNFNEKQVIKLTNSKMHNMHFRKLHNTGENFLTESGVYKLIFKSKKKEAEKFQDWVTDEVLPQIRKTGSYTILENRVELLINDIVKSKINEIEKKCSEYYKINDIKKKHISQYIKNRLGIKRTNNEYKQVKERIFLLLGVNKWEDIDMDTFKNSINTIDESIRVIKMERPYEQLEFK